MGNGSVSIRCISRCSNLAVQVQPAKVRTAQSLVIARKVVKHPVPWRCDATCFSPCWIPCGLLVKFYP